jgi:hypothetical protein
MEGFDACTPGHGTFSSHGFHEKARKIFLTFIPGLKAGEGLEGNWSEG